ncbi:hypothetical protein EAE96_006785 [Botrytis aclada]|nr:hypothetical protein EAE96_006785 [Botrytis aclada]
MFEQFVLRHIPPLFIATTVTVGGATPFIFGGENAIKTFGLPQRLSVSKPAQAIMILSSARASVYGIALWGMYLNNHFAAMDILFASMGYLAFVDSWVCWKEGSSTSKVVFRGVSAGLIALWGLLGMTAGA